MTLAVIVARKDDFFIIADTRSSENHQSIGPIYHDQEQKVFHSSKHKIGLAIAGDAVLPDPSESDNIDKQIRTSWLLKQFFVNIEARNTIAVDKLFSLLMQFIGTKYPQILEGFKNNVSLFYGGFTSIQHQTVTAIFSYHEKHFNQFLYTDGNCEQKLCAFSNDPGLVSHYVKQYLQDDQVKEAAQNHWRIPLRGNLGIRDQNLLLSTNASFGFLQRVLTINIRDAIVKDHNAAVVGTYFNFIKIDPRPTSPPVRQKWQITGTGSQKQLNSIPNLDLPYPWVDAKTTSDFRQKILDHEVHYYDLEGQEVIFNPNPSPIH